MKRAFSNEEERTLESELTRLQNGLKSANDSMSHTIEKLDKLHVELKASDPR